MKYSQIKAIKESGNFKLYIEQDTDVVNPWKWEDDLPPITVQRMRYGRNELDFDFAGLDTALEYIENNLHNNVLDTMVRDQLKYKNIKAFAVDNGIEPGEGWKDELRDCIFQEWKDETTDLEIIADLVNFINDQDNKNGYAIAASGTVRGCAQSDWGDYIFCTTDEEYTDLKPYETLLDQYWNQEVYGFVIEKETSCDCCGSTESEVIDSCWGFYGEEFAKSQGIEAFDSLQLPNIS